MVERRRRNKVFMLFSEGRLFQLRTRQWNALTSYRQSAFGGLFGLSAPLNYEYMALDCVTFNIVSSG